MLTKIYTYPNSLSLWREQWESNKQKQSPCICPANCWARDHPGNHLAVPQTPTLFQSRTLIPVSPMFGPFLFPREAFTDHPTSIRIPHHFLLFFPTLFSIRLQYYLKSCVSLFVCLLPVSPANLWISWMQGPSLSCSSQPLNLLQCLVNSKCSINMC